MRLSAAIEKGVSWSRRTLSAAVAGRGDVARWCIGSLRRGYFWFNPNVTTSCTIKTYAFCVIAFLFAADALYASRKFPSVQPTSWGTTNLINRLAWYKEHTSDYNLVFIGDSRTYCGIHAELLDPLLGSSSINLASFSNWFPTQYAFVKDLVPHVPAGTTVVWSIGPENFRLSPIQRVYPIGIENALQYMMYSVPTQGLADNVLYYNRWLYFFTQRGDIREHFLKLLAEPFKVLSSRSAAHPVRETTGSAPAYNLANDPAAVQALEKKLRDDPRVAYIAEEHTDSKLTSLTLYFKRGSYYRIELDSEFFRHKQQEMGATFKTAVPEIDPPYWRLFSEMLAMFKRHNINLVVNEVEEAPYVYGSKDMQRRFRQYMREHIKPTVLASGFKYIEVDYDKLSDADYFDYNHLNSLGAQTFTPLLAAQLRPLLKRAAGIQPADITDWLP